MIATPIANVRQRVLGHHARIGEVADRKRVEISTKKMLWFVTQEIRNRIIQQIGLLRDAAVAEPGPIKPLPAQVISVLLGKIKVVLVVLNDPGGKAIGRINYTAADEVNGPFKGFCDPSE